MDQIVVSKLREKIGLDMNTDFVKQLETIKKLRKGSFSDRQIKALVMLNYMKHKDLMKAVDDYIAGNFFNVLDKGSKIYFKK